MPRQGISLLPLLLALLITLPAHGQTLQVQNGATLQVSGGAIFGLEGGQMDLGGAGATATLDETSASRVTGGTLKATRNLSSPSSVNPGGLGAIFSASVDLGDVTITRGHTAQSGGGNASIKRYFDISPSKNNSGLNADLKLEYRDEELNGLSESNLEFFKSNDGGSSWTAKGISTQDQTANTATLQGVSSFSRWTLGSSSSPLPVELAAFEATATDGGARLSWKTASETNNAGFEVQRQKRNGWTQVGYVDSKASGGSTTESKSYRFAAEGLPVGAHRFRLRQVDLDGSSTLTDPVSVNIRMKEAVRLKAPAPNPVSTTATLSFAVEEQTETTVTIYNTLGQKVATAYEGIPQAEELQTTQLDISKLASGTYFLRLEAGGQTRTQRLTVVK